MMNEWRLSTPQNDHLADTMTSPAAERALSPAYYYVASTYACCLAPSMAQSFLTLQHVAFAFHRRRCQQRSEQYY